MEKKRSKSEWVEICKTLDSSEETVAAYARRRGVSEGLLYNWRKRLHAEGVLGPKRKRSSFVEVVEGNDNSKGRVTEQYGFTVGRDIARVDGILA